MGGNGMGPAPLCLKPDAIAHFVAEVVEKVRTKSGLNSAVGGHQGEPPKGTEDPPHHRHPS
jgi:hypothetical protein